jgi:hypothetical protein
MDELEQEAHVLDMKITDTESTFLA